MEQFIATSVGESRNEAFELWEYDLSKPRDLAAEDPRAHYAAKRFHGRFDTMAELRAAISASGRLR